MQQQMDDKELVITTLASMDDRIVATDFLQDWQSALQLANPSIASRNQIGTRFSQLYNEFYTPFATAILFVAVFCLGIAAVLLNDPRIQKEPELEPAEGLTAPVSLDPNRPWYGPTDDLLQVAVLRYETQWPTYAIYDPLTMEIK